MYSETDFIPCSTCGDKGIFAPDTYGKVVFFHKRPSKIEGYFTFSELCKVTNPNVVGK